MKKIAQTPTVNTLYVHQNADKSLDVRLEFNGDFEDSVAVYIDKKTASISMISHSEC